MSRNVSEKTKKKQRCTLLLRIFWWIWRMDISRMVYYYDLDTVRCTLDLYRHMVARKLIHIDLESKIITPDKLFRMAQKHLGGVDVETVKEELRLKYLEEELL